MSRVLLDTLDECRRELRGLSGADSDERAIFSKVRDLHTSFFDSCR